MISSQPPGQGRMSRGRRQLPALALLTVCWAVALAGAHAAVDVGSAAGAGAAVRRVPCSSLPELRHLALKVAILGECEPTADTAAAAATLPLADHVELQSLPSSGSSVVAQRGWIFTWKKGAAGGPGKLNSAACTEGSTPRSGRFNATCTHRYSAALPGFAARFQQRTQLARFLEAYADQLESAAPDAAVGLKRVSLSSSAAGAAAAASDVAAAGVATADVAVDSDVTVGTTVRAATLDSARWGLDRLDQPSLPLDGRYRYWNDGQGVSVYVLDTGIRASHLEFRHADGRPGSRASEVFAAPSLSYDPSAVNQDCEGHGTHVAAVVGGLEFGVAKGATLHAVRILDCQGNGAVSDVLLALDWLKIHAKRPAIVSMSLGGEVQLQLDEAVRSVTEEGIHVVVAAGNEDMDACDTSPAREASAVTVGATTVADKRLWLIKGKASNFGECVDLFAPGTDILSAAGSADDAQQLRMGTSQAVPFVAGVMALVLQNATSTSPPNMRRLLVNSAAAGKLSEVEGSGYASLEASSSPNLLLQSSIKAPILADPTSFPAIESASDGPFRFTVALTQRPTANVRMELSVDGSRGALEPSSLSFGPDSWMVPQSVKLTVSPFASTDSSPLAVRIDSRSADSLFAASQTAFTLTDRMGDTLNYPKPVMSLPFSEQSSTGGGTGTAQEGQYQDDYGVVCGKADGDRGGSPDVVYYFKPASDCTVTASLCGSSALPATFNSRLYLLEDVDRGGALQAAACSNDACGALPSLTASLKAGVGYAFVVDGVGGAYGQYSISITAEQGGVSGELPPASLLQASVSVASMGPAASASGGSSSGYTADDGAGSSHYWLLGPWSSCSAECTQNRKISCYDSNGGPLSDSQCSDMPRPASQQACSGCDVQANSSVENVGSVGGGSTGGGGSSSVILIAACTAGAALAVAAATAGFIVFRRRQRRRQEQQQKTSGHVQGADFAQGHAGSKPGDQWGSAEGCEKGDLDCIPLPKQLRPISTGRNGQPLARTGSAGGQRYLMAAAGTVAVAHQQQQQQQRGRGRDDAARAYNAAVTHLQSVAPDYHVVHLPSPRFQGQDTGSPSGVRRSLRQRSPTRRPREGGPSRATPDAPAGEHRLARSSSGHPAHDA